MPDLIGPTGRMPYEDAVLATKPVLYAPMQGSKMYELVLNKAVTESATKPTVADGPFADCVSRRFSASTSDHDSLTVASSASYHPGDTFSVGGWFNRLGNGASSGVCLHLGPNDLLVWFNASDKFTLRKAGVSDIFQTDRLFGSPYAAGWHHGLFTKAAGSGVVCYLDGVSVTGTYVNATVVAGSGTPTFGIVSGGASNDLDGMLAHWAIWNRVLTANEVLGLYLRGVS